MRNKSKLVVGHDVPSLFWAAESGWYYFEHTKYIFGAEAMVSLWPQYLFPQKLFECVRWGDDPIPISFRFDFITSQLLPGIEFTYEKSHSSRSPWFKETQPTRRRSKTSSPAQ